MLLTIKQKQVLEFVKTAHGSQKRKYTGEPYWTHPYAVAEIVAPFEPDGIEIALCHDIIEDTSITKMELLSYLQSFGYLRSQARRIVNGVVYLTDVYTKEAFPHLNRPERKKLEAERLGKVSPLAQSVKYADILHNTSTIKELDKWFSYGYLLEKKLMLNRMNEGNAALRDQCLVQLNQL